MHVGLLKRPQIPLAIISLSFGTSINRRYGGGISTTPRFGDDSEPSPLTANDFAHRGSGLPEILGDYGRTVSCCGDRLLRGVSQRGMGGCSRQVHLAEPRSS